MNPLVISTNQARVRLSPEHGAGVLSYELANGAPIFRSSPRRLSSPFELACNVMLPWCNRVSNGGFTLEDQFHSLPRNMPDQPHPLHGNAFLIPWRVTYHEESALEMAVISRAPGPYHYEGRIGYSLVGQDLTVDLAVWHWGETPLPYGIGLHPWFNKDRDTTVQFTAQEIVLVNNDLLPVDRTPVSQSPAWDFTQAQHLPHQGIDNAFAGWNGHADFHWPSRDMKLRITTDPALPCCHVFTPDAKADFFCFEPVSHLPNAHNWSGAGAEGLHMLSQGQCLELRTVFAPIAL